MQIIDYKTFKSECWICGTTIEQRPDGEGGYEIGLNKWFTTLEPWNVSYAICKSCFSKVSAVLHIPSWTLESLEDQKSMKKTTS